MKPSVWCDIDYDSVMDETEHCVRVDVVTYMYYMIYTSAWFDF